MCLGRNSGADWLFGKNPIILKQAGIETFPKELAILITTEIPTTPFGVFVIYTLNIKQIRAYL